MAASLLTTAAFADALTNFTKSNTYTPGSFGDVTAGDWYSANVASAYEYGLLKGQSDVSFGASSNVKISEIVALAARINSIYNNGSATFTEGTPWYQTYVDYAVSKGIISSSRFENYDAYATRLQVAEVLASSLPSSAFSAINNISVGQIPDLSTDGDFDYVYMLYNAGILTGKTTSGAFGPSDMVLRCEVAAVASRMVDTSLRVKFSITAGSSSSGTSSSTISSKNDLLTAVNNSRQYISDAVGDFAGAYSYALAGSNPAAVGALNQANNAVLAAAKYAQDAAAFCKSNSVYSAAYEKLNDSYLACLDASTGIKAIAANALNSSYTPTDTLVKGIGEALSTAYNIISAVSA